MTSNGPPPTECQILQFRQLYKLKYCHDVSKNTYQKQSHLIAISTLYGVTFLGEQNGFKVVANDKIFEENCDFNSRTFINTYRCRNIPLPSSPTHIDINSQQRLLAVAYIIQDVPVLRIYVIDTLFHENVTHYPEVRLSASSGTHISDLSWNPGIANVLACCISDGTLLTYSFNDTGSFEIKSLPMESHSVCVCWSPKGKQIVVGNSNGYLTQYLPELKAVKNFPPPTGLFPKTCSLCSIKWLSNFQFIGVYRTTEQSSKEDDEIESRVVVINTPKNAPVTYINYDDVCFSAGTDRPVQYYFTHIPSWNLIFVSSSNSVEVAVLGLCPDNVTWIPWNVEPEENRILLPITKTGEAFPVGVSLDMTSRFQTPIGDKIISMPTLSVITCEGLVCVYLVNYMNPAAAEICIKSNTPSLQYFASSTVTDVEPVQNAAVDVQPAVSQIAPNQPAPVGSGVKSDDAVEPVAQISDGPLNLPQLDTTNQVFSVSDGEELLNNTASTNFHFTTAAAKQSYPETISVAENSNCRNQEKIQETRKVERVTSLAASKEVASHVKKVDVVKARQEILKKLKKRASVFENDIQEIKYLVSNIRLDDVKIDDRLEVIRTRLEIECTKLKSKNSELRNDIDCLKTSIIEVFACVQDAKSKSFQLMNPDYQSLFGVQDMDPINSSNLNSIENTINYVQTQVEKANKQLEETWFKFTQNPGTRTTKVPLLENVYETMVKQQRILTFLKVQTEEFEKRFSLLVRRFKKEKRTAVSIQEEPSRPWTPSRLSNDCTSLEELTNRALTLNSVDDDVDPIRLAQKLSREHAKRYHLSHTKQIKLQELLNASNITYIQSSRLQRLKKRSLIILSKTSTCDVNVEQKEVGDSEIVVQNIGEKAAAASRPCVVMSPVNLEEERPMQAAVDKVISSTPMKSSEAPRFSLENTLASEPPIMKPVATTASRVTSFSLATTTVITPALGPKAETHSKPTEISMVERTSAAVAAPKAEDKPTPITSVIWVKPNVAATSSVAVSTAPLVFTPTPRIAFRPGAFSSPAGSSVLNAAKPVTTTGGQFVSPFSSGSFFSTAAAASAVAVTQSAANAQAAAQPIPASTFSFGMAKIEPATSAAVSFATTNGSLFGAKPVTSTSNVGMACTTAVTSPFTISGDSLFKNVTTAGALPSFGSLANAAAVSPAAAAAAAASVVSATPAAAATVAATSVFGGSSLFGKSNKPAASAINVASSLSSGSMFSGKPAAPAAPPVAASGTQQKTAAFGSFSFANVDKSQSTVTITEISSASGTKPKENKENVTATNVSCTFSFANAGSMMVGEKSESPAGPTPTVSVLNSPVVATTSGSSISTMFTSTTSIAADLTPATSSTLFAVAPNATLPGVTSPAAAATTSAATLVDSSASFFGGLSLGAVTTTTGPTPMFAKTPTSSAPSMFSGSGGNIFMQTANSTASTAPESKPIFGTGNTTPLFGQGAATAVTTTTTEHKSIFGTGTAATSGFQSGGSLFGSGASGGGSLFGSSTTFGNETAGQTNSFGLASGSSMFGSGGGGGGFGSPFQGTTGSFASPPSFPGGMQQQTPAAGGFGSPATFGNVFNKTGSSFSTFGAAASFGGSPSFGTSPTKVFGQTTTNMGTFGTAANQNTTGFEALASNENSVTFGNLAQQQQPSHGFGSPPAFGGVNAGSVFGAAPKFENNSFSSWR